MTGRDRESSAAPVALSALTLMAVGVTGVQAVTAPGLGAALGWGVAGALAAVLGGLGLWGWRRHRAQLTETTADQAHARAEARRALERFEAFEALGSDFLWESDAQGRVTHASPRLGWVLEGHDALALEQPLATLLAQAPEALDRVRERTGFRQAPVTLYLPDGTPRSLHLSAEPVLDNQGDFAGYRGCGRDMTAESQAHDRLAGLHDLMMDAVASLSEGFVLFDENDHLVVVNDRYRHAYPRLFDVLVPGARFADILRVAAERGDDSPGAETLDHWIEERLTRHLHHHDPVDRRLSDGRWYRISEHGTRGGGVVKVLMDITEIKQREAALWEKSALLETILESITQGLGAFDRHGRLVAWNSALFHLLESPPPAHEGERILDRLRAGTGAEKAVGDEIATALRPPHRIPPPAEVHNGLRTVELRLSAMSDGGVVATLADVSSRRRVEDALRDLARTGGGLEPDSFFEALLARLALAVEMETVVLLERGHDGLARLVTAIADPEPQAALASGYSLATSPLAILGGDRGWSITSAAHRTYPDDPLLVTTEAESLVAVPLHDMQGRHLGLLVALSRHAREDLSQEMALLRLFAARVANELERRTMDRALRESEQTARQLVEDAPYGVLLWDGTSILFANTAAADLLGQWPERLAELTLPCRLRPLPPHAPESLAEALAPGETLPPTEVTLHQEGDRDCVVEISSRPLIRHGVPVSLVVISDITERRLVEAELQQNQKMKAVGQLAGGVAHEFNNMLTAIGGFARMIARDPEDTARVRRCVDEITKAGDRAATLTAQLLDFSRGTVTSSVQTVDLTHLVCDLRGFLKPLLGETIDLNLEIPDHAVPVRVDPARMNQVVVNLAINARDAMANGGTVTLAVDEFVPDAAFRQRHPTEQQDALGARCARLRVSDTGCGIDPALQKRIFEPFFTTKPRGRGTGLGLPLVYGTVQQAGGVTTVESRLGGGGTTFALHLPLMAPASPAESTTEAPRLDTGPLAASLLLVEDETQVREMMTLTLEQAGASVHTAADGAAGLIAWRDHGESMAAIVSDVTMPRLTGPEMVGYIRQQRPHVPVLFLTGYATPHELDSLERREQAWLMRKPVTPEALVAAVRAMIAGHPPPGSQTLAEALAQETEEDAP